jgi:hypothetical protein
VVTNAFPAGQILEGEAEKAGNLAAQDSYLKG